MLLILEERIFVPRNWYNDIYTAILKGDNADFASTEVGKLDYNMTSFEKNAGGHVEI